MKWGNLFLRFLGFAITLRGFWWNARNGTTHFRPWRRTLRYPCQDCGGRLLRSEVHIDETGVRCFPCIDRLEEQAASAAKGDR